MKERYEEMQEKLKRKKKLGIDTGLKFTFAEQYIITNTDISTTVMPSSVCRLDDSHSDLFKQVSGARCTYLEQIDHSIKLKEEISREVK